MVHFKLKFKLMEKGLVPKQIDLFQIQPKTECVQPSALRVNVEGDLSSLAVPHTGGTSSSLGQYGEWNVGPMWLPHTDTRNLPR